MLPFDEAGGGAGHLAPLETPEAFRRLLVDFLGEREAEVEG